jgi:X-Pro dipeptidyl-peptidase (S15 family)
VAIAFDYRNFGGSGGKPREVLSVPRQRADYSTVIGWAVEQPYIDPRRIIAWGTSFAGMHIIELAVSDTRLAAAIAQAPLTDGLAAAMMSTLKNGGRIFALALLDCFGSLFGRQPIYIPGHGMPGDLSIGATPDGPFGEKLMTPKDGTIWHDSAQLLLASTSATRCLRAYPFAARCPRGRRHCARPGRPRGCPQGTVGRIVPQRRSSLRRLRRRSKLRRRAANGGRLPPPPRENGSPKGVLMALPDEFRMAAS